MLLTRNVSQLTSQYKYLIAIVVIVFGILAWWTIKPLSATADPKCATNAYLIKHFRFTKGVKDNDTSQVKWGPEVEAVSSGTMQLICCDVFVCLYIFACCMYRRKFDMRSFFKPVCVYMFVWVFKWRRGCFSSTRWRLAPPKIGKWKRETKICEEKQNRIYL